MKLVMRRSLVVATALVFAAPAAERTARAQEPAVLPGFHVETDLRVERVGQWVLVGSYVVAAMVPTFVLVGELFTGGHVNSPPLASVWPNYIPLAGPFISLSTSGIYSDHGSVFYTRISLAGQLLGAGIWTLGRATRGNRLVPDQVTAIAYAPIGSGGLTVVGRF